ncbi:MAG: cation:dicarboxylase symporter family transporter [Alphaproteobacteria bacterium]|nr:cation:dicarboxylase symporter family transporter [Alphaproteobacteria bacterium]
MTLATQVLLGMLLGIAAGAFFGEEVAFLKVGGQAFIMLLQMTVIPYMTVALMVGIGQLTYADAKRLALSGGAVLVILWGIGLTLVFLSPLAYPNWPSASFFSASLVEEPVTIDFLNLYIPANPFNSLANAIVPAVVVFSVLVGLAMIGVENKAALLEPLSAMSDVLMRITGFVANLAPYGVFAIIASAAGTLRIEELSRLQVYIVIDIMLAIILSFWILPGLITAFTPIRYGALMTTLRGPLLTAFATGSVLIVVPLLIRQSNVLLRNIHEASPQGDKRVRPTADILIPTFFTFPNLGLVMSLAFILFGGWYIGARISVAEYPTIALTGFASLFGGPVVALPFLLNLLKLPADLFQLYFTADVLSSRFGTLLAAMHLCTIALIGACIMNGVARFRLLPFLRFAGLSVALVLGGLMSLDSFYTNVVVAPYTKADALEGLQLLRTSQDATVHKVPPPFLEASLKPRPFDQVQESGVLRVCYGPHAYPWSYFNSNGDLVGFDIEMAHLLARRLGLELELLPLPSAAETIPFINKGYCDIAMTQFPVIPSVAIRVDLTDSFKRSTVALLLHDYLREEFATWNELRDFPGLRVGMYGFDFTQWFARRELPDATLVPMRDAAELGERIDAGLSELDVVLNGAEEAAAWTILHPYYSVVVPRPVKSFPVGYALPRGSPVLLKVANAWLALAQQDGTIDRLHAYWVEGKISSVKPPRWSVIRDVLGWID